MTKYEVRQGEVPAQADAAESTTKYPWPQMEALGVDYFEVPLGDERASRVVRRLRSAGQHWCKKHRPQARPEVRHDAAEGVVRCWLVAA